jgi:hypothetical protein
LESSTNFAVGWHEWFTDRIRLPSNSASSPLAAGAGSCTHDEPVARVGHPLRAGGFKREPSKILSQNDTHWDGFSGDDGEGSFLDVFDEHETFELRQTVPTLARVRAAVGRTESVHFSFGTAVLATESQAPARPERLHKRNVIASGLKLSRRLMRWRGHNAGTKRTDGAIGAFKSTLICVDFGYASRSDEVARFRAALV